MPTRSGGASSAARPLANTAASARAIAVRLSGRTHLFSYVILATPRPGLRTRSVLASEPPHVNPRDGARRVSSSLDAKRTRKDLHADRQPSGGLAVDVEQYARRARRIHA